jgi:hypothetical protein
MTVVELKRFSELAAASTKNVPAISAFFMISESSLILILLLSTMYKTNTKI